MASPDKKDDDNNNNQTLESPFSIFSSKSNEDFLSMYCVKDQAREENAENAGLCSIQEEEVDINQDSDNEEEEEPRQSVDALITLDNVQRRVFRKKNPVQTLEDHIFTQFRTNPFDPTPDNISAQAQALLNKIYQKPLESVLATVGSALVYKKWNRSLLNELQLMDKKIHLKETASRGFASNVVQAQGMHQESLKRVEELKKQLAAAEKDRNDAHDMLQTALSTQADNARHIKLLKSQNVAAAILANATEHLWKITNPRDAATSCLPYSTVATKDHLTELAAKAFQIDRKNSDTLPKTVSVNTAIQRSCKIFGLEYSPFASEKRLAFQPNIGSSRAQACAHTAELFDMDVDDTPSAPAPPSNPSTPVSRKRGRAASAGSPTGKRSKAGPPSNLTDILNGEGGEAEGTKLVAAVLQTPVGQAVLHSAAGQKYLKEQLSQSQSS